MMKDKKWNKTRIDQKKNKVRRMKEEEGEEETE